jgi:putative spermidine/putrescine transport system permease protein
VAEQVSLPSGGPPQGDPGRSSGDRPDRTGPPESGRRYEPLRLSTRLRTVLLLAPVVVFLLVFFFWPVVRILGESVGGSGEVFGEYRRLLASSSYVQIILRTMVAAAIVTVLCLLIAYPYAYLMTRVSETWLSLMVGVVLVSFFTSVLVRSFAWIVMLQRNGVIDQLSQAVGLGPMVLRGTTTGVVIAMVQIMLPFMIFPLYSAMVGIDRRLELAASSLGASRWTAFWRVHFPLSLPGVVGGSVIVFVTSLGFYIIPGLIGSPSHQLLSHLIYTLINTVLDVPLASAASVVLLLLALVVVLPAMYRFDIAPGSVTRASAGAGLRDRINPLQVIWAALVSILLLAPSLVVIPLSLPANRSFVFPPTAWSTRWYTNFFQNEAWYGALIASLKVAAIVTVVTMVLSLLAALALRRASPPTKAMIRSIVLTPRIVPGVIIAMAVYAFFLRLDLAASTTGYVIAHVIMALPFTFIPVAATLERFDVRLEHAAASLGASPLTILWSIVLPIVRPSVLTGGLFACVISFDEVVVSLFISGTQMRTLPVQMFRSITTDVDPTIAAAATMLLLATVLLVVVSVVLSRRAPVRVSS